MAKNSVGILEESAPPRRSRAGTVVKLLLIAALTPIIYEGTMVCVAQWRSMYGPVVVARTPVLDFFYESFRELRGTSGQWVPRQMRGLPWKPAVVIPLIIAWTGLAVLMLRRC